MNKKELDEKLKEVLPSLTNKELTDLEIKLMKIVLNSLLRKFTTTENNVSNDMDNYNTYLITDKNITEFLERLNDEE